jgi:hypothetical protein
MKVDAEVDGEIIAGRPVLFSRYSGMAVSRSEIMRGIFYY